VSPTLHRLRFFGHVAHSAVDVGRPSLTGRIPRRPYHTWFFLPCKKASSPKNAFDSEHGNAQEDRPWRKRARVWPLKNSYGYKTYNRTSLKKGLFYVCVWNLLLLTWVDCHTGYPVLRNKVDFKRQDKAANKEDLNRIVTATKVTESCLQMSLVCFAQFSEWQFITSATCCNSGVPWLLISAALLTASQWVST